MIVAKIYRTINELYERAHELKQIPLTYILNDSDNEMKLHNNDIYIWIEDLIKEHYICITVSKCLEQYYIIDTYNTHDRMDLLDCAVRMVLMDACNYTLSYVNVNIPKHKTLLRTVYEDIGFTLHKDCDTYIEYRIHTSQLKLHHCT